MASLHRAHSHRSQNLRTAGDLCPSGPDTQLKTSNLSLLLDLEFWTLAVERERKCRFFQRKIYGHVGLICRLTRFNIAGNEILQWCRIRVKNFHSCRMLLMGLYAKLCSHTQINMLRSAKSAEYCVLWNSVHYFTWRGILSAIPACNLRAWPIASTERAPC